MGSIFKNEWQFLLRTRIVQFTSLGFLLLLFVSIWLSNMQNQKERNRYQEASSQLREQWESIDAMNPHSAAHYGTYVFKPSNALSGLDDGVRPLTGNVLRVEGHVQNEIVYSEASQMMFISRFGKLRSSLLLQYVIPLLLIFLAFQSMSNERQYARLKLLVLQGARPITLIFSKTLTIWLYGTLLLLWVVLVHVLTNFGSAPSDALWRLGGFILSYSTYYFIITGLTVVFSSMWRYPAAALTTMLGFWILWTIFLPGIFLSTVEEWHPLPSREEFQTAMREDRSKGLDGHNPQGERVQQLEEKVLATYGVDSISQLPINFDGLLMQEDEEYGNQVWDKHFGSIREVYARQKSSLQALGILNPFSALQNCSMGLTGNDNLHHQEFLLQVERYRRVFIKMLNDKHAYGGSKTGDWSWTADNDFFRSVPDFKYKPVQWQEVNKRYNNDGFILLGWWLATVGLMSLGSLKMNLI